MGAGAPPPPIPRACACEARPPAELRLSSRAAGGRALRACGTLRAQRIPARAAGCTHTARTHALCVHWASSSPPTGCPDKASVRGAAGSPPCSLAECAVCPAQCARVRKDARTAARTHAVLQLSRPSHCKHSFLAGTLACPLRMSTRARSQAHPLACVYTRSHARTRAPYSVWRAEGTILSVDAVRELDG
jgi:hypothetical protein